MGPHCVWEIALQSTTPKRRSEKQIAKFYLLARNIFSSGEERGRSTSSSFFCHSSVAAQSRGSRCDSRICLPGLGLCCILAYWSIRQIRRISLIRARAAASCPVCGPFFFSAVETNGAISLNSSIEVLFNFKSRRIPISTSALSAKLLLPSHVSSSGRCLCVLHLGSPANPSAPFSVPDSNRWIISARTTANPTTYLIAAAALPNGDTQKVETAKAESSGCDDSTRCRSAEVQTRRDETKRARLLLLSLDVKSLVCAEPLPFTLQGLIRIRCKLFFFPIPTDPVLVARPLSIDST